MKTIMIIGIAPDCKKEIKELYSIESKLDIMLVGMDAVGTINFPVQYIVTNHQEDIPVIISKISSDTKNYSQTKIITPYKFTGSDIVLTPEYEGPSGSSSIVGALAAIQLGYDKIILCGCPLIGKAFEGNAYEAFHNGWIYHKDKVFGKVKSMSGWTRELLGAPTKEWMTKIPI
jgi:hypothetical protein